jgi:hypothetical protein
MAAPQARARDNYDDVTKLLLIGGSAVAVGATRSLSICLGRWMNLCMRVHEAQ